MVASRDLPERTNPLLEPTDSTAIDILIERRRLGQTNPLLEPTDSTAIDILIERRRLGQTNLAVKAGAAGVANATKAENLGVFDYAHLRVPLPKDLSGSGIFTLGRNTAYPESYFLMRRSSDGYVSATGMFKAAFPWASLAEEEAERRYQKTFPSAGPEEVAGSVWIAPEEALSLADEYSMRHWIEALLHPEPIEKGSKDRQNVHIQMPPKFDITNVKPVILPPTSVRSTRARSTRSASPSKMATPRKIATPRKSRTTRGSSRAADAVRTEDILSTPVKSLQPTTPLLDRQVEDDATPVVNGDAKSENVHIAVKETVEEVGDAQTTTTNVSIDIPATYPDLRQPEDPTKMIEEAKRMVAEARELEGASSSAITSTKRKVEEVIDEEELALERPAKASKVYTTEQKLTKEKVTRRALVGLGVMAAIGSALQYFA